MNRHAIGSVSSFMYLFFQVLYSLISFYSCLVKLFSAAERRIVKY